MAMFLFELIHSLEENMKKLILLTAMFLAVAPSAFAQEKTLSDAAAESFITRHFPDAEIPGPVKGLFHYVDKNGKVRRGYAECFVPAMGERSDGVVSSCDVIY
jgi:hypothetical protein